MVFSFQVFQQQKLYGFFWTHKSVHILNHLSTFCLFNLLCVLHLSLQDCHSVPPTTVLAVRTPWTGFTGPLDMKPNYRGLALKPHKMATSVSTDADSSRNWFLPATQLRSSPRSLWAKDARWGDIHRQGEDLEEGVWRWRVSIQRLQTSPTLCLLFPPWRI